MHSQKQLSPWTINIHVMTQQQIALKTRTATAGYLAVRVARRCARGIVAGRTRPTQMVSGGEVVALSQRKLARKIGQSAHA
jgi:hypothetical protein